MARHHATAPQATGTNGGAVWVDSFGQVLHARSSGSLVMLVTSAPVADDPSQPVGQTITTGGTGTFTA
jgi:hypothetical protein